MNRTGFILNSPWTQIPGSGISSSFSVDAPIVSIATKISLIGYLASLAVTQTVYGWPFMAVRWAMLAALAASSTADIILSSRRAEFKARAGNGLMLTIYLLLTFSTVIYAENWMFSGMRWASHAVMLAVFLISLPQLITFKQIRQLLFFMKYLMAALVIISWAIPPAETMYDNAHFYQGAMGNANSMGHIAFITAFFFLQGYITEKLPRTRNLSAVMALIAVITIWRSGARSSMIALMVGVLLLCFYYGRRMRGLVLVSILAGSIVLVSIPQASENVFHFAQKTDRYSKAYGPMQSRIPVWSAAYEGFRQRPLVGWGFGADSSISKVWNLQFTSLGAVDRDPVNDFLFMMEGSGIIGLASYLILIAIVLKQRPRRFQRVILQSFDRGTDSADLGFHHAHVVLYILPICLLALNQFDNSALSAGNLISVTLWLCAGCAAVLRNEIKSS